MTNFSMASPRSAKGTGLAMTCEAMVLTVNGGSLAINVGIEMKDGCAE